jgi:hypothetical protein
VVGPLSDVAYSDRNKIDMHIEVESIGESVVTLINRMTENEHIQVQVESKGEFSNSNKTSLSKI